MGARIPVVMNAAAGSVDEEDRVSAAIEAAFAAAGAEAEVHRVSPSRLAREVRDLVRDHDVVAVAGGDGTIGTAASAVSEAGGVLGVLPLGTFNHFAKDLGIAVDDLDAAASAVVHGDTVAVDLAEVNGRPFVNNSSLGVYPAMVDLRDRIRDARGVGKLRAVPVACWRVVRRFPVRRLQLTIDGRTEQVRTPFVFIGNNRYELVAGPWTGRVGSRASLQDGVLSLYVARTTTRRALVVAAVVTLLRGTDAERALDEHLAGELLVGAHGHRVLVALDGEITTLRTPLRYRVRPGALRVRVPATSPGGGVTPSAGP